MVEQKWEPGIRPKIGYASLVLILLLVIGITLSDLYLVPKSKQTVHAQVPGEEGKKDPPLKMPPLVVLRTSESSEMQTTQQTQQPETNATPSTVEGEEATTTNETPPAIEESQPTQKPDIDENPSAIEVPNVMSPTVETPIQGPREIQGPKKTKKKAKKKKAVTVRAIRDIKMYRKADGDSKVIRKVRSGSKLKVTGHKNGYLKVTYKTKKGKKRIGYVHYLYTTYLEKTKKKIASSVKMSNTRATIDGSNVNFRSKPRTTAKVKTTLEKDEIVEIISYVEALEDEEKGWYLAKKISSGMKAFVYGEYVVTYVETELPSSYGKEKTSEGSEEDKDNDKKSEKETSKEETKKDSEKETSKEEAKKDSEKETSKEETKKDTKKDSEKVMKDVLMPETKTAKEDDKEDKKEDKKENNKKKETEKKKSPKPYSDKLKPTEANVDLLAKIMDAETGYPVEKAKVGQTFINKAVKFKTTLRKILTAPKQYPTTRRKIDAGKIKPLKSTKKLAKQLLSREKNGFEGTDVPKSLWNKVMYQANDDPSEWSYPVTVVSISQHYYALDYLMKKNGKPVKHLNKRTKVR